MVSGRGTDWKQRPSVESGNGKRQVHPIARVCHHIAVQEFYRQARFRFFSEILQYSHGASSSMFDGFEFIKIAKGQGVEPTESSLAAEAGNGVHDKARHYGSVTRSRKKSLGLSSMGTWNRNVDPSLSTSAGNQLPLVRLSDHSP